MIADEGTLLVGTDVKPGTYKTTVPPDSHCYWARLNGTDGSLDSIITSDIADAGYKVTVTIKSSDKAFKTEGCGTWVRVH